MSKFSGYQIEKTAITKPLMEKKRRERMNRALNEMKNILLETMGREITCHSKLEKADILENAVEYLKLLRDVYGVLPGAPLVQCIRDRQQGHLSIGPRLIPVVRNASLSLQLPLISAKNRRADVNRTKSSAKKRAEENGNSDGCSDASETSPEPFRPWAQNKKILLVDIKSGTRVR
ncbi:unnamed protein product [Oikopleura dioica]|uniref:BHLH domain-containing protein n=1 Tax=Oikopleura dioica TaxID=34765 RepID=E4XT09_OIKDI|nr:unnamed protein product [Oikopleura dioica]